MKYKIIGFLIFTHISLLYSEGVDIKVEYRDLPNVKIKSLKGRKKSTKKILNGKYTMMSFWATWCVPCLKEMKELETMHYKYEDDGFQVIGISIDDSKTIKKISTTLKSKKISYPIYLDTEQRFFEKFNTEALPFSILVSPDGKILWEHSGYIPGDEKKMEATIVDVLNRTKADPSDSTKVDKNK